LRGKKEGRALREGTARWGWERTTKGTECERGKGVGDPFPSRGKGMREGVAVKKKTKARSGKKLRKQKSR
jgi:hypothetical protein